MKEGSVEKMGCKSRRDKVIEEIVKSRRGLGELLKRKDC